jgi:hypothetical protein
MTMLEHRDGFFQKACKLMIALGFLNFFLFLAGAAYLGGDAVNGKIEGGRYYLRGLRIRSWSKGYTEVSKAVFTYSEWHVYSLFATGPLIMAAALALNSSRAATEADNQSTDQPRRIR